MDCYKLNGTNAWREYRKIFDDGLTFNKIVLTESFRSINFLPVYSSGGTTGGGIRCQISHDGVWNYHTLSNLTNLSWMGCFWIW